MTTISFKPDKIGDLSNAKERLKLNDLFFQIKNDLEALARVGSGKTTSSVRFAPQGQSGLFTSGTVVGGVPAEAENRIRRGQIEASAEGTVKFTFEEIPPNVEVFVNAVVSFTAGGYSIGIPDYTTLTRTSIDILVDGAGTVRCGLIYY